MNARRRVVRSGGSDSSSSYTVNNSRTVEVPSQLSHVDNSSAEFAGRRDPEMSCRDRTGEFFSAVKSMQSRQVRFCMPIRTKIQ